MTNYIAKRAFNLDGTDYAKGDKVPIPAQQFDDLEPTGFVERAPTETKVKAKSPSRAAKKAAAPAAPVTAPESADKAD